MTPNLPTGGGVGSLGSGSLDDVVVVEVVVDDGGGGGSDAGASDV
jgi:hypothetical protein